MTFEIKKYVTSPRRGDSLGNRGVERSDTPGRGSRRRMHPGGVPLNLHDYTEAQLRSATDGLALHPACSCAPYGVTERATASAVLIWKAAANFLKFKNLPYIWK